MKSIPPALLIILFLTAAVPFLHSQAADALPTFKASDTQSIIAKSGQKITVRGTVSSVRKSNSGTNFVNFENSEFYMVTFKSDLPAFTKGEPADLYQGKYLAVTGVISLYNGKAQIKLNHPSMVKIIGKGEPFPEPEKNTKPVRAKKLPVTKTINKSPTDKKKKAAPVDSKKYFK